MSSTNPDTLLAELGTTAQAAVAAQSAQAETESAKAMRLRRDWIAKQIIWVLIGSVGLGLVICLIEGWRSEWSTATTHAIDLIKSVVLPIVTLVLGYYFGQASHD